MLIVEQKSLIRGARRWGRIGFGLIVSCLLSTSVARATDMATPPGLESGFNRLYNLDFPGANADWAQRDTILRRTG